MFQWMDCDKPANPSLEINKIWLVTQRFNMAKHLWKHFQRSLADAAMRQISSLPKHVDHKSRGDAEVENVNLKHLLQEDSWNHILFSTNFPMHRGCASPLIKRTGPEPSSHPSGTYKIDSMGLSFKDNNAANGRPLTWLNMVQKRLSATQFPVKNATLGTALQLCTKPPAHTWNKFVPSGLTVSALSEVYNL